MIESIEQIFPDQEYKTWQLTGIKYRNGKTWGADLNNAKKQGAIQFEVLPAKGGHLFKGAAVIDLYERLNKEKITTEAEAREKAEKMTTDDIVALLTRHKKLKEDLKQCNEISARYNKTESRIKDLWEIKDDILKKERIRDEIKRSVLFRLFDENCVQVVKQRKLAQCGVYFLISNQEILYIGQSKNLWARLSQHSVDKDFDEVRFIECSPVELDEKEMFFIKLIKPPLNGQYKNQDHEEVYQFIATTSGASRRT